MNKYLKIFIVFTIVLLVSTVPHFINMFHYPYYENDEGTYMSQAWSLLKTGELAPYTYWYDHAPAGWFLIALWVKLTGGFFTFGTSVNSGRVLMLVIHILSSFLLFYIAKKLSKSNVAGIIAVTLFSLSPLGIYFQRRVLLDNIMIFWVLLSLALLLRRGNELKTVIFSAISFGIAVLTKENAVFFIPAFLYLIYTGATKYQKEFFVWKWLAISFLVISIYFLYAILKGEFFPVGFMGDTTDRVSLITTLKNQYSRGTAYAFWDTRSDIYRNFIGWSQRDPFILVAGTAATMINLLLSIKRKEFRLSALLSVLFMIFLARGKLVLDFYIVPMIPIFALNIGVLLGQIIKKLSLSIMPLKAALLLLFITIAVLLQNSSKLPVYAKDETSSQSKAIEWIKNNLNEDDKFIIDDSIFVDLHEERFPGDKKFPHADWSWKAEEDPEVYDAKLKGDWTNIQYLILSHEILKQIKDSEFKFIKKALDNSYQIKLWRDGSSSYVDIPNYISTNGDWMGVYKINDKNAVILDKSWEYYKDNFLKSYGQIVDPQSNNTTSEGQAYAMQRALWLNDRDTFDNLWKWTQDHLQHRVQDKLISWLWLNDGNGGRMGDSEAASDADEDIALSLLFAHKKWGDEHYLNDAMELINDIWEYEVVEINNRYYLISGPGGKREDGYLLNPSYLAPANYRIFAQVDKEHNWNALAQNSYRVLNELAGKSVTGLPPNWVLVDSETGELKSPSKYISDPSASWYGYDAFRVMFRVAIDQKWFKTKESVDYLKRVQGFFEKETANRFFAVYSLDGSPRVNYEQLSIITSAYFALEKIDNKTAKRIYEEKIEKQFNFDEGYYGDGTNYFDQNWAWFASAFHHGKMINYWEK